MSQTVKKPKREPTSPVTAYLFDKDIAEIERRAAAQGLSWSAVHRLLVRKALQDSKGVTT